MPKYEAIPTVTDIEITKGDDMDMLMEWDADIAADTFAGVVIIDESTTQTFTIDDSDIVNGNIRVQLTNVETEAIAAGTYSYYITRTVGALVRTVFKGAFIVTAR